MISPQLVVFGPQTPWPNADYAFQLRSTLLSHPRLRGLLSAIKGLPELWKDLVIRDARLRNIAGDEALRKLINWIDEGELEPSVSTPPNIFSMPLTVIIHLTQLFHYLDNNSQGVSHQQLLESTRLGGIQGFCIGLLSAVAVASAKDEEDIIRLGGVALRLAACIGAYIDLDCLECNTTVLAVRWNSAESHNHLIDVVKDFPNVWHLVIIC